MSLGSSSGNSGQYRIIHQLNNVSECSLLVVCDRHIVLCREKKLICLTLTGDKERYTMGSIVIVLFLPY